jgi:hypothetical protein
MCLGESHSFGFVAVTIRTFANLILCATRKQKKNRTNCQKSL